MVLNKSPDDKFRIQFRNICLRPAMYVGEVNYKLVCALLTGLALGFQDWHGGMMHSFLHEEFQQFLVKKYCKGSATFKQVMWEAIIPQGMKLRGKELTEKQLIDQLLQDFQDFDNILVRMAIEIE